MLASWLWMLATGFVAGQLARYLGAPALLGMLLAGIALGPELADVLTPALLESATALRTLAVLVILMKAGLGLDRDKLRRQSSVALRLGFLPALGEMIVITFAAMALFDWSWLPALLLGCLLSAESPAVIVPGMLRLKRLGWGVTKGIPDAVMTGSALSDVLVLSLFSLLLATFSGVDGNAVTRSWLHQASGLLWQIFSQIVLGVLVGYGAARLLVVLLARLPNRFYELLVSFLLALALVLTAEGYPYFSGYLAVMMLGFVVSSIDAPLARRLRQGFDNVWLLAEIPLFVLLGANVVLAQLAQLWLPGLLLLVLGTGVGRMAGWWLSTWGSDWTWRERLFLLPANSAKATVQAAIGALPLAFGVAGGEVMLALAALSILVSAPLGAWAIGYFAPRWLERGEVDPSKVNLSPPLVLLSAIDHSVLAEQVLKHSAAIARRSNADVIVVHVNDTPDAEQYNTLQHMCQRWLSDIRYRLTIVPGPIAETILTLAHDKKVTEIIIGKQAQPPLRTRLLGSVAAELLSSSDVPIIVVEDTLDSQPSSTIDS